MAKNQEKKDEKAIEEGLSAIRRQYYGSVRGIAKDILEDAKSEYGSYDEAYEYIDERIREDVDGNYWVIYTHATLQTMQASDNWLAIDDMGIEMPNEGLTTLLTQAAYYAMEADVRAQIEAEKDDYFREENPRPARAKRASKASAIKNKLLR